MIAQIDHLWVIANFKETQLHKMHPGQRVDIKVDALSKSFAGEVEAMAAATGGACTLRDLREMICSAISLLGKIYKV